jgi:hypothetical protein
MTQDHPVPQPDARHKGATTAARCGAMGHHGRCILTQGHDTGIAHLYATPATPVHAEPPVDGLRQRIALAVGAHRNGPASDGLGWFRDETDEHACYALADAVLPLFAAEHAAGRRDGLREGAAALQAVIDRNTPFASRSQSHVALRGAREIVLDLAGQDATPTAPPAEPVVAYRARSGYLFCLNCGTGGGLTALTSDDLPDGGLCADCDADVFAVAEALPPTLAALRDLISADPGAMTTFEALASARTLLAAHARELADLVQQRISVDRADNPGGGQMAARNHTRRGGMMTARWVLDRYADDLEQQAASGEQA